MEEGERRKKHKPTFTREHTKKEKDKIRDALTDKPLSQSHTDRISEGVTKWWRRRKAEQASNPEPPPDNLTATLSIHEYIHITPPLPPEEVEEIIFQAHPLPPASQDRPQS